jgi:hypothetical protein
MSIATRILSGAAILGSLAGCAAPGTPGNGFGASYTPVVDMKGVDPSRYNQDLAECRAYASQVDASGNAVAGALIGGALMAALSGAAGNRSYWNQRYAATGAVAGGASAGASSLAHQRNIIGRCMVGRGYNVLG